MIAANASILSVREWIPVDDPSVPGGSGWMGQVPPPDPTPPKPAVVEPAPVTGHESPSQARDDGWLGQVPPPAPRRESEPTRAAPIEDCIDGEDWLGQVPPPESTPPREAPDRHPPTYANPQLAPEPTLFG